MRWKKRLIIGSIVGVSIAALGTITWYNRDRIKRYWSGPSVKSTSDIQNILPPLITEESNIANEPELCTTDRAAENWDDGSNGMSRADGSQIENFEKEDELREEKDENGMTETSSAPKTLNHETDFGTSADMHFGGDADEEFVDALSHRSSSSSSAYMSAQEHGENLGDSSQEPGSLLRESMELAQSGQVKCRKFRTKECNCKSDADFLGRLHCLRGAMNREIVGNDTTLSEQYSMMGRNILMGFLLSVNQDPTPFFRAYDELTLWLKEQEDVRTAIMNEVEDRGVVEVSYFDIALDFTLLDAIDDLNNPPNAVMSILGNNWIPERIKGAAVENAVWGIIRTKGQTHVTIAGGFLSHFYSLTACISPVLSKLLLVPSSDLRKQIAESFKTLVIQYCRELFSLPSLARNHHELRTLIVSLNNLYFDSARKQFVSNNTSSR